MNNGMSQQWNTYTFRIPWCVATDFRFLNEECISKAGVFVDKWRESEE
jgi:hypothetical protein